MIHRATLHDLLFVAHNMREWDRREIFATRWAEDPAELAVDCWRARENAWIARRDEDSPPVAAIGAIRNFRSSCV